MFTGLIEFFGSAFQHGNASFKEADDFEQVDIPGVFHQEIAAVFTQTAAQVAAFLQLKQD